MATRTVTVELQARVTDYVRGTTEAARATEKVNDELDDLGKHERDFAEVEKGAAGLTAAAKEAAKAADSLGDEVDDAGTQMKGTAADANFLAGELAKARREAEELAVVLRAGGGDADVLQKYKTARSKLADLERLGKSLTPDAGPDMGKNANQFAKAGESAGKSFFGGFSGALESAGGLGGMAAGVLTNPLALALLLPTVALVGAEVGGVFGGAVVAGIAAAGIGAGVAAAFQDPEVKAAGRGLVATAAELAHAIGQEFAEPTREGIHILRAEIEHLTPSLRDAARQLAPMTTMLAGGLAEGMDRFASHLTRILANSQPLVEWLSNEIPDLADEIGGLLENMSEHADEARVALNALFGFITLLIKVLEGLADAGAKVIDVMEVVSDEFQKLPGLSDNLNHHLATLDDTIDSGTVPSLQELAKQLNATAMTADTLAGAMTDKVINTFLAADHATLSLAESQTRLAEALKENGHAFDIHSAKGQANREAILGVVEANLRIYDTMIAAGYSAEQAAAAYDSNTAALEAQLKKAGFTKKQIQDLIGEYRNVPDKVNTSIAVNGLTDAINDLNDLLRAINGLPPRKTIVIEERRVVRGASVAQAQGGHWAGRAAAVGMFLPPSDPGTVLAGEPQTGGEWLIPQSGISSDRAAMLLTGAARPWGLSVGRPAVAGGMSPGAINIRLSWAGSESPMIRAFMGGLRAEVQGSYRGNVQLALGQ